MCLGIPAKVIKIDGERAIVRVGETQLSTGIQLVPEVRQGEYVIIHAGFAIQILNEKEARETLELLVHL